jgi:exodeoxyribonuclease-3
VWDLLSEFNPDIALLQEVSGIPDGLCVGCNLVRRRAITRYGTPQRWDTVVLSRYPIASGLALTTSDSWVREQAEFFRGNLVSVRIAPPDSPLLNVVSVHSQAWEVAREKWAGTDMSHLKLAANPEIWCTEILWDLLRQTMPHVEGQWMVGGDFNSSPSLDDGVKGDRGNREIMSRMTSLGLVEVLLKHQKQLTPTFRNPRGGDVIHQLDHIFVSKGIGDRLIQCGVCPEERVFGAGLSDHLPIIAEFETRQKRATPAKGAKVGT